jgi:anaerobic selenocysteine-containing dehydrogenase
VAELEIKHTSCFWCHDHCNVAVYVEDGKPIKIMENQRVPHPAGLKSTVSACPHARAAVEWIGHPDRLN